MLRSVGNAIPTLHILAERMKWQKGCLVAYVSLICLTDDSLSNWGLCQYESMALKVSFKYEQLVVLRIDKIYGTVHGAGVADGFLIVPLLLGLTLLSVLSWIYDISQNKSCESFALLSLL